jgi:serine/threonine protein kinase
MTPSKPPAFPPGYTLLRKEGITYEVVNDLGTASHGERVVLARRLDKAGADLGRVIVKFLLLPALTEATKEAHKRLDEEVQLATFLRHQNIARIHGMHSDKWGEYVIMEAVSGLSLDSLLNFALRRGRYFSECFVLHIGAQVASALVHAHTRRDVRERPLRIVHRAIDPTRIRVKRTGKAKLTDFGLASAHLPGRRSVRLPRARGDAYYTSPEALLGQGEDARSDLFVLGLVLLEFATGWHLFHPPELLRADLRELLSEADWIRLGSAIARAQDEWAEPDIEELVLRAATYTPDDVAHAAAKLSEPVRALFQTLLRRDPAQRFASASELEQRMRRLLHERNDYGQADAAAELQQALTDVGELLSTNEDLDRPLILQPDDITTDSGPPAP